MFWILGWILLGLIFLYLITISKSKLELEEIMDRNYNSYLNECEDKDVIYLSPNNFKYLCLIFMCITWPLILIIVLVKSVKDNK